MTTVTVSKFVLGLYEDEMRRVIDDVLDALVEKLHIDKDDAQKAIESKLAFSLTMAPPSETFVVKRRKRREKKVKPEKEQCVALTNKKNRCTRFATLGSDMCNAHCMNCKFGRIDD